MWYLTRQENITTDTTPNNPNGLDTFIARFFNFGNLVTTNKPSKHGKIDKSRFDIKAEKGTSKLFDSFSRSVASDLPKP